jgi:hypothetical protein
MFSLAPSDSNDDASSSRPLFPPGGGLMEHSNTSLQRGCQNFCCASDEPASHAHLGPDLSRAVHPYSHPLQLEHGVVLAGLSGAHFDGICSTT